MRKLTARWVPKSLSDEQMAIRASVCSALLKRFRSKEDDFLSRLVTVDETWIHYYELQNKAQSRQWVGPGSLRPKKFKTQPSAGKVMATVFLDAQGVIMLYFPAKKNYNNRCVFCKFTRPTENCDSWKTPRYTLQKDSAPTGQCESSHLQNCNGCCLAEWVRANTAPRLFSGLSSYSDYFLFPNLKKGIRGRHFRSNEEVMAAVEEWVGDKDPGFFSSGLMALKHHWSKCIILEGNYIEKEEIDLTQK